MAKIRVYEFARDLNMTNRELLDKIRDLDIDVSSHMSSLDEDAVGKIKAAFFGEKDDQLEEKRVRPTVIRRRKVISPQEQEQEQEAENAIDTAPDPVPETVSADEPEGDEAETETPAPVVVSDTPEPEPKKPPVKRALRTESAKIISRPLAPPEPSADTTAASPEEADPPAFESEKPVDSGDAPSDDIRHEAAPDMPVADEPEVTASGDAVSSQPPFEEMTAEPAPPPSGGKAKKTKKEMPAKIIKLPEKTAALPRTAAGRSLDEETPRVMGPGDTAPRPDSDTEERDASGKDKKKKGGRRKDTDAEEALSPKKKGGLRKKEIVEGAALYSHTGSAGKTRGQKGRKGAKAKIVPLGQKTAITTAKAIKRRIKVDDTIVLAELAKRMGIKASDMIVKLMGMGVMATVNQTIDYDTAVLVAGEFNYEVEKAAFEEDMILKKTDTDQEDPDRLQTRPPVVTIMGHVDHGKTSLLDVIRKTRVTEGEAGGITQHIGAYHVETEKGLIAFLDTPGHEAFSAMRSRGAKVTDLVVLVVAADDGVKPQTIEAINHAKASGVPIIVAINKMDKPEADPERVQRELSDQGLAPEAWGGETIFVEVSAKKNTGIDELLDMILLQAEILELKANPNKLASGHVVEAKLDAGRGPVATVLVQDGTLRAGDSVVCGIHYGKIRVLQDDLGRTVESAGPSMPVEIIGLSGVPMAGDELVALADEKDARQVSQHRMQKQRAKELAKNNRLSLEGLFEKMQKGEVKDLNLIIRADVDGSIEALRDSLVKLSNDEVSINVIHAATGTITESDISLAAVSNAIIIGFNVRPNARVQEMAADENVDMRFHNIIYNVIKEVKDAIVGMMESTFEERVTGRAEVRQTFHVPKIGTIAGCYVTDGKIQRGNLVRLLRDGVVIYEGKNSSLRRFKDDVKEVQAGYECGIGIENFNDIKAGDMIESYYMEEIRPEVE
ncbi:translation initiation factor IF-2 [Desulfosarcina sp. OttesenSCG-928-A07]|nr:translation initiation factor IF-2 [Desulfosarcina sp. OttesenSCG-928-G17]MDL2328721.1 translation initiation factor IF-2 [Desulfosarcina sp. OttesenSCG-928-A07]